MDGDGYLNTMLIRFQCINLNGNCDCLFQILLGCKLYHLKLFILVGKIGYVTLHVFCTCQAILVHVRPKIMSQEFEQRCCTGCVVTGGSGTSP